MMRLVNARTGQTVCSVLEQALDPTSRMKGLLGRDSLPADQGLWIEPCSSIHTFFMKFAIDAAFVSSGGEVLRIFRNLKPFRLAFGGWSARAVIEAASGEFGAGKIAPGDTLQIIKDD